MNSKLHFKSVSFRGIEPGPPLIVLGAVHGNKTWGTRAIHRVIEEIDSGALEIAAGEVTFVPITNPLAYARGEGTGDRNLNRNLGPKDKPAGFEVRIANWLCPLLARHDVLLDLHSTRAPTSPFAMLGPRDNAGDIERDGQINPARCARLGERGGRDAVCWHVSAVAERDAWCPSLFGVAQAVCDALGREIARHAASEGSEGQELRPRAVLRDVGNRMVGEGDDGAGRPVGLGRAALDGQRRPASQVLEDEPHDLGIVDERDKGEGALNR